MGQCVRKLANVTIQPSCIRIQCSKPKQKFLLVRHRLDRKQHRPFLSNIVSGDEKCYFYAKLRKRKKWLRLNKKGTPQTKGNAHPQKIMLSILVRQRWCVVLRIASARCNQLRRLADVLQEK